jgi:predicted nucleic acid-binding protein
MILLDTDILIDLLRQYPPAVDWLSSVGGEEITIPGFAAMELLQGCRDKTEQEKVERALGSYGVVWPSVETCEAAFSAFVEYRLSHNLGLLDSLIGQMAVALNLPLYTFNQKHYAALISLKTIQPYKK